MGYIKKGNGLLVSFIVKAIKLFNCDFTHLEFNVCNCSLFCFYILKFLAN